jgi:hypothetical protein
MASETGQVTGTKDKDYNLIWFTEKCPDHVLRLETYIEDSERDGDDELATLFRTAQADSRKGAEQAKQLLRADNRLAPTVPGHEQVADGQQPQRLATPRGAESRDVSARLPRIGPVERAPTRRPPRA